MTCKPGQRSQLQICMSMSLQRHDHEHEYDNNTAIAKTVCSCSNTCEKGTHQLWSWICTRTSMCMSTCTSMSMSMSPRDRRGATGQTPALEIVLTATASPDACNLNSKQAVTICVYVCCRMPLGQKLCYRPVFDVETLLTPPPDPFNLKPPAQHKVHSARITRLEGFHKSIFLIHLFRRLG